MKIVALDPGGTTGICVLDTVSYEVKQSELGPDKHHMALYDFLRRENPDVLVVEDFTYQVRKSKGTEMNHGIILISRDYIGVAELFTQQATVDDAWDCKLVMQTAAQGGGGRNHKGFWQNDKLKKIGLLQTPKGRQHMADALRHALYYLTFTMKDNHFVMLLKD